MGFNLGTSRELSYRLHAEPKACWWNAFRGLQYLYYVVGADAHYVEGFASGMLPVVEHAWIELEGLVVDPTPNWCGLDTTRKVYGRYPPKAFVPALYFPGLRYTLWEVEGLALQHPHPDGSGDPNLPLVWRTGGWGGFGHPEYLAAKQSAERAAYGGRTLEEILNGAGQ